MRYRLIPLGLVIGSALIAADAKMAFTDLPAKTALQRRAAGGLIGKVESVTSGNSVSYEAVVVTKSGKHTEIAVNPDGTSHHD